MNRAFIFPGQGSQIIGMGKDFYDNFHAAKITFDIIDDTLNYKLSDIIFYGSDEELTLTKNTQPALMAVSMAIINVIQDQANLRINDLCQYVAGHSLGEYTALCAAESISLVDAAKLLRIRGESMQNACEKGVGTMAACIGADIAIIENILSNSSMSGVCQIANDNIEGQIVISGHIDNVEQAISVLKDSGYKAIKLKVSAPFHCDLMKPAELQMRQALKEITINPPVVPIITNISARATSNQEEIKENLIKQVCGRVRWRETLSQFVELGVQEIVEIGSGRILTNMCKKTAHPLKTINISNIQEFAQFMDQA